MDWFSDTAVYCLSDFISKITIWLLNGHISMIPLVPIRIDSDGIPLFRLLLADIPTIPGLRFKKVFPQPEKFNISYVMYFLSASQPYCVIKAHSFNIQHALQQVMKGQIFIALQLLIGRISMQCNHCQCTSNGPFRPAWLDSLMPHPNFTGFSHFSLTDALKVIQDNMLYPIVTTNLINSIGLYPIGQSNFTFSETHPTDTPVDQPIRL
jgi:hypothetical protein